MKIRGYTRVSTQRQKDEATIKTQVEHIKRRCTEEGHELLGIYVDNGISGESTFLHERPEGKLLIEEAKTFSFDAVMVYHPDRLGRHEAVSMLALRQLYDELGIIILDVNGTTDVTSEIGRFQFLLNAGFAKLEHSRLLKRSMDGTRKHAEDGVWLGGIVPYGYRVEGKKKSARLRLSTEKIPGFDVSEVEVVQMIYRWSAIEKLSCLKIAERLQTMGVPTSYARTEGDGITHKRNKETANLWRDGRVRNMLVETYYKGIHHWGKRQKRKRPNSLPRPVITRTVPAIVDEETWEHAQQTLSNNRLMSSRNSKRQYLLRGKMKCALCGLTYAGSVSSGPKIENVPSEQRHIYEVKDGRILRPYYCCTGKSNFRGLYGKEGKKCPSRMVNSQHIENAVWANILEFLADPDEVLKEIQTTLAQSGNGIEQLQTNSVLLRRSLATLEEQKDTAVGLHIRKVIDEQTLISQLNAITAQKTELEAQIERVESELAKLDNQKHQCQTTQELLSRLNDILSEELTFEVKREIVDALVDYIRVETHAEGNKKTAELRVFFRFEPSEANSASKTRSVSKTPTETGKDVRAVSCWAEAKVIHRGATKENTNALHKTEGRPAPARRHR